MKEKSTRASAWTLAALPANSLAALAAEADAVAVRQMRAAMNRAWDVHDMAAFRPYITDTISGPGRRGD